MQYIVAKVAEAPRGGQIAARAQRGIVAAEAIPLSREDVIKDIYTDREVAIRVARELATKHPTQQYGLFSCEEIFETTTPKVMVKHFNADGELVEKK